MSRVDRLRRWLIIVDLCTLVLILVYLDACIPTSTVPSGCIHYRYGYGVSKDENGMLDVTVPMDSSDDFNSNSSFQIVNEGWLGVWRHPF
jgi:hypothetical protein